MPRLPAKLSALRRTWLRTKGEFVQMRLTVGDSSCQPYDEGSGCRSVDCRELTPLP